VPEKFINRYVDWRLLNQKGIPPRWPKGESWYEDDWYLINHPAFYEEVYVGLLGLKDYLNEKTKKGMLYKDTVPSREVWRNYLDYLDLTTGKDRDEYRWQIWLSGDRDFDKWLVDVKGYTPIAKKIRKTSLTAQEKAEEAARKIEMGIEKPK